MNRIFACWISENLIYGDPVVCLFSVFASLKLFSFYRPPKDRTKLALNLDSWKTIYLKFIALFLSVFFMYNFHLSLAVQYCFIGRWKHFSISSFWIVFRCVFRLYFLVFSEMLSVIVKEWKFCCIRFRFVLWSKKINSFLRIQFSQHFSRGKEKI